MPEETAAYCLSQKTTLRMAEELVGKGARGKGRVVVVLLHLSQSSQESAHSLDPFVGVEVVQPVQLVLG